MVLLQRRKEDNLLKEMLHKLFHFFFHKFELVKNHFMMVGTPVNRSQKHWPFLPLVESESQLVSFINK